MKIIETLHQVFKHEVELFQSDSETLVFAHRGSKCNRPENTLAAFEEALRVGTDGIELDVHLSKDEELMVIHDEIVDRTTTGNGLVRNFTRRELQTFDAGVTFDSHFRGQKIPTLPEVLQLLKECDFQGTLNIEIKTDKYHYPDIEQTLSSLMISQNWPFSYIYCSFNFKTLQIMSEIEPRIELCYLTFDKESEIQRGLKTEFIGAIHPKKTFVFKHRIRSKHAIKPLRTWTLNTEAEIREAFKLQLAGFMTDFPELALKIKQEFMKN
jgi:glycerophosphoryl diester phosphodiesterase